MDFLKKCPLEIKKHIGNKTISLKHFLIKDEMLEYPFEKLNIDGDIVFNDIVPCLKEDITIIGHDHDTYEINNKNQLICLDSAGLTKDDNTFYHVLEIIDNNIIMKINRVKYDRISLEKTLNTINYPDKDIISKYFFGINTNYVKMIKK